MSTVSCLTCTSIPESGQGWRGATLPPLLSLLTCRHEQPTGGGYMKTISVSSYRAQQEVDISALLFLWLRGGDGKGLRCAWTVACSIIVTPPQGAFPGRKRTGVYFDFQPLKKGWGNALTSNSWKISRIIGGWLRQFMIKLSVEAPSFTV